MTTKTIAEAAKASLDDIFILPLEDLRPSIENEVLYGETSSKDPAIRKLARDIKKNGQRDPIVITRDGWILSGHRRYAVCKMLRIKEVKCRVDDVWGGQDNFMELLASYNNHRNKTPAQLIRESMATQDRESAYSALIHHRDASAHNTAFGCDFIEIRNGQGRRTISEAKTPMLEAIRKIVYAQQDYWPLSDRSIHYELLNDPPLRNAVKPESRYKNHPTCYKDLTDMLTRMRLAKIIPFDCIDDPTRTSEEWKHLHSDVGSFVDQERDGFLMHYRRNLMQSQPCHIEIMAEKNTVESSVQPVALQYCIPYTISRGYPSIDARQKIFKRFEASGKDRMILLVMSDFDPEGEDIAHSTVKSLNEDFLTDEVTGGWKFVKTIDAIKVGLTHKQAVERNLPQTFDIKKDSSRYAAHFKKYGDRAHELEALPAAERSRLLAEAIDSVIDVDAFNRELAREKEDSAVIAAVRSQVSPLLLAALNQNPD